MNGPKPQRRDVELPKECERCGSKTAVVVGPGLIACVCGRRIAGEELVLIARALSRRPGGEPGRN
jgi:hypothetical protein